MHVASPVILPKSIGAEFYGVNFCLLIVSGLQYNHGQFDIESNFSHDE